jgi:hypothetical protein
MRLRHFGRRLAAPVPLGQPEQPRHLLDFLGSPESGEARQQLPTRIVTDIATAAA